METQRIKSDTLKTSRSHSLYNTRLGKMHHGLKLTAKDFLWWTSWGWEAKIENWFQRQNRSKLKRQNPFSPSLQNVIHDSTSEGHLYNTDQSVSDWCVISKLRVSQGILVSAPWTLCYSSKARGIVTFNNGTENHWDRKSSGAGGISLAFVQCQVQCGGLVCGQSPTNTS